MKRWIIGLLIVVVLIGGMAYWLANAKIEAPFLQGKVATAERKTLTIPIKATGLVEPAVPPIEIKSKASGEVQKIYVKAGDIVQKGQLLLELDPKDEQRALERAKAQMDQSEAMYEKSKVAAKQLEADQPEDVKVAQALLDKTRAVLEQVKWDRDHKLQIEESNSGGVSEQEAQECQVPLRPDPGRSSADGGPTR